MNAFKSKDQQAIAKLVRAFVSPSTPPEALAEVISALRASVRSPSDIIGCETIPDRHFLKIEALVVRDAFEAATNGMSSPEAFSALDGLSDESVFAPWKHLVHAILAFHECDCARVRIALARIPANSFPGKTSSIWRDALERIEGAKKASFSGIVEGDRFLSRLFPQSDSLASLAEEISEALNEGMHDLFVSGCGRFLRELVLRSKEAAARAALFILKAIDARGESPDDFLLLLKACLGEAESLRLTALYLSESRPSLALLFWIKAASRALEGNNDREAIAAWALVIERAVAGAKHAEGAGVMKADEYRPALDPLIDGLAHILSETGVDIGCSQATHPYDRLMRITAACRPVSSPSKGSRTSQRRRHQLELFA